MSELAMMNIRTLRTALCLTSVCMPVSAQTLFSDSSHYPSGAYPRYSELGDVDGDGQLDVVVTDSQGNALRVHLGDGQGGFTAGPTIALPGAPRGIALADLDGDGALDACVVLPGSIISGEVWILWGDGSGGFTLGDSYTVAGFPVWVEVGDLDGSSGPDLVVGSQTLDQVEVFLAQGGGSFGAPTVVPAGASVEELALGDLEGDGDLDIFVGSWLDNRVGWLIGDGSGAFAPGVTRFGPEVRSIALADMDANGTLDLVTVSSGSDQVLVYKGLPGGSLGAPASYSTQDYPTGVGIADMNADGVPDVVVACRQAASLDVFVGTGEGRLAHTLASPADATPEYLLTGLLDGDGIPDIVVTEPVADTIGAYLGDGVGSYVRYCEQQTTSEGCVPELEAWGTPSVSDLSPFTIYVGGMQENQAGIFAYAVGGDRASIPYLGGTLCIGPSGILRTPAVNTGEDADLGGSCTGRAWIEFNGFALGQGGGNPHPDLLLIGTTYRVQLWSRDPGAPFGANLSSAIEVMPWL